MEQHYYEAYDDRYRQVHQAGLQWFDSAPSPIVAEIMDAFQLSKTSRILEIGCGEGRDAIALLEQGYPLLATDISPEAIRFCRSRFPKYESNFQVLDCIAGQLEESFDMIFAVAVIHMLVVDEDRCQFYRFIRNHLRPGGIALICSMGDGKEEFQSDIHTAFQCQERRHEASGTMLQIAGTSCRVVSSDTFTKELTENGLTILQQGHTAIIPDFPQMIYAVVKAL